MLGARTGKQIAHNERKQGSRQGARQSGTTNAGNIKKFFLDRKKELRKVKLRKGKAGKK